METDPGLVLKATGPFWGSKHGMQAQESSSFVVKGKSEKGFRNNSGLHMLKQGVPQSVFWTQGKKTVTQLDQIIHLPTHLYSLCILLVQSVGFHCDKGPKGAVRLLYAELLQCPGLGLKSLGLAPSNSMSPTTTSSKRSKVLLAIRTHLRPKDLRRPCWGCGRVRKSLSR